SIAKRDHKKACDRLIFNITETGRGCFTRQQERSRKQCTGGYLTDQAKQKWRKMQYAYPEGQISSSPNQANCPEGQVCKQIVFHSCQRICKASDKYESITVSV